MRRDYARIFQLRKETLEGGLDRGLQKKCRESKRVYYLLFLTILGARGHNMKLRLKTKQRKFFLTQQMINL